MGKAEFVEYIKDRGISFTLNESMKKHTTFKIGGNADIFVSVEDEDELICAVNAAKTAGVPYFIIGKGSNLLVSDAGIEGAVICLERVKNIDILQDTVTAAAGVSVRALCSRLQKEGLSGFEFAYGIPGTVGGAVYMNAGAYGGEVKDCITSAKYLDKNGKIIEIKADDMGLSYRKSVFQENGGIILSAKFRFKAGKPQEILEKMEDYLSRRKAKQPLNFPSAGSTFRRPEGNYAGTLIEKSGLKGEKIGGAMVSNKHAGFIVNTGGAKSADVEALIEKIQGKVLLDSGVKLQPEVIYIGR